LSLAAQEVDEMLRLLLDEHISPRVAHGLRRRHPMFPIRFMSEWEDGEFLGRDDSACLTKAVVDALTLVTYDRRTIPLLLKGWAEQGRNHGGVTFIDEKTIPPSQISSLVRALDQLFKATGKWDWTNRVCFLQR
jgi:hypothetical protein